MSDRKEITKRLSIYAEMYINPNNDPRIYYAKEVTFDYATAHATRVDFMKFKPVNNTVSGIEKGDFYCYEVKSTPDDFRSGHGLNFIGDYNYIITTPETYEAIKKEIPHFVGVLIPSNDPWRYLESARKAKRKDRTRPALEMLLMMYRSAQRERDKDEENKARQTPQAGI